jgi:ABC-type nitrate/sulfonate/bicarbonate transport system permease component
MKFTVPLKTKEFLLGTIPFLLLLIIWQLAARFNLMPKWFLPNPLQVAVSFENLAKKGIILNILADSTLNLIPPYLLAAVSSIVLGIIIGTSSLVRKIIFPFISALYPIPSLAWLPFIIILIGFNRQSVWVLLFISSFLRMIYNMVIGVRNLNPIWILVGKNLGLNKTKLILKIIIPGALPNIITGLRIGFGSVWRSVIGAEMLVGGAGGLGNFMINAQFAFDFDKIFVGIFLIAIIGLLVETFVFKKIETITLERWGVATEEV